MSDEISAAADIARSFRASTWTGNIIVAYGLHRALESRTPDDLYKEAAVATRLMDAIHNPLPESDPMFGVFAPLNDPIVSNMRGQLVERSIQCFIGDRQLGRTMEAIEQLSRAPVELMKAYG